MTVITSHIVDPTDLCAAGAVDLFDSEAAFVRPGTRTGIDWTDRVLQAMQDKIPADAVKLVRNFESDFIQALADTRKLIAAGGLGEAYLIFNALVFKVSAEVSDRALHAGFRESMGERSGKPRSMFHVDFPFSDNRDANVAEMANILAYAKLTGTRVLVVGPIFEKWIGPNDSLERGISGCGEYNDGQQTDEVLRDTGPAPVAARELFGMQIDDVLPDRVGNGFSVHITSALGREAVFEIFRSKLFAVDFAAVQIDAGGTRVVFPDFGTSSVRNYFSILHVNLSLGREDAYDAANRFYSDSSGTSEFAALKDRAYKMVTIRRYYEKVDEGDGQWVVDLFADDNPATGEQPVYDRGEDSLVGQIALRKFYIGDPEAGVGPERKIHGKHTLEKQELFPDGTVIVRGRFDGHGAAGNEIHVGFTDYWAFDPSGKVKVSHRVTHLASGARTVRE